MTRRLIHALLLMTACSGAGETASPAPGTAPPEPAPAAAPAASEVASKLEADPRVKSLFAALPADFAAGKDLSEAKTDLGRMLYYDGRLSKDGTVSCNSCHQLDNFGVDNEPTSPGVGGTRGGRNSPTVYNAAGHLAQFWDGREADVEAQAKGPILNPVEMALPDGDAVVAKLKAIPGYVSAFQAAWPDGEITYDRVGEAIGAFERKLVTPAPFDAFLQGDASALNEQQTRGLQTYLDTGCTACHSGALLGGSMYQKLGLVQPWETADAGRFEATKNEADKGFFKVPSLRNITRTGPYLHDGSEADLGALVRKMASHQLGKQLTDEQVSDIVAFLGALEGQPDAAYIARPELPADPA